MFREKFFVLYLFTSKFLNKQTVLLQTNFTYNFNMLLVFAEKYNVLVFCEIYINLTFYF